MSVYRKFALVALLVILAVSCHGRSQDHTYVGYGTIDRGSVDVSLIQLIANPKEFDGKRVRVKGYLNLQFEGDVLYVNREAYRHEITSDGIWVHLGADLQPLRRATLLDPQQGYALLEGIFDPSDTGHLNCCSGALRDVSRVEFDPPSTY